MRVTSPESAPAAIERSWRNDAFSFWKLPENWRAELSPSIGESESIDDLLAFHAEVDKGLACVHGRRR